MKQRSKTEVRGQGSGVREDADQRLREIILRTANIKDINAEYENAVQTVTKFYANSIEGAESLLKSSIMALMQTMKVNKAVLFDGTDVVNLPHGSLIHSIADKVSIPKTALAECKAQGFQDVIKIVESLDRDKIEKWPDAKLVLIGAERKQKEEFSYDLKK
jgi:cobalamin biosynthesis Co2+ chelatase CbiK